jgi:4-hydroxybenzoate polyprenyltransferase
MTRSAKIRPLLATARIANVPSVISNVWVGMAIGAAFQQWNHDGSLWLDAVLLMLAGVFLYVSGNFLNDWHDREWDVKHRPERALPTGLFSPATYLMLALAFAASGLAMAFWVEPRCAIVAALIVLFIVIYTRWHKRAVWPVIPMGLCRALLPVMGFVAVHPVNESGAPLEQTIVTVHAIALLVYIAALSLGARYESSADPSKLALGSSKGMLVFSGLLAAALWFDLSLTAALIGLLPFAIWMTVCLTKYRRPIPVHVSALLAGIPLIDCIAMWSYVRLEPVDHYPPAIRPYIFACFLIPALAFVCGRLLQRLAPAT